MFALVRFVLLELCHRFIILTSKAVLFLGSRRRQLTGAQLLLVVWEALFSLGGSVGSEAHPSAVISSSHGTLVAVVSSVCLCRSWSSFSLSFAIFPFPFFCFSDGLEILTDLFTMLVWCWWSLYRRYGVIFSHGLCSISFFISIWCLMDWYSYECRGDHQNLPTPTVTSIVSTSEATREPHLFMVITEGWEQESIP